MSQTGGEATHTSTVLRDTQASAARGPALPTVQTVRTARVLTVGYVSTSAVPTSRRWW